MSDDCKGGYLVRRAGSEQLNGCYLPAGTFNGAPKFDLPNSTASLFRYAVVAGQPMAQWNWGIGTIRAGKLLQVAYSSPCATQHPIRYGWRDWNSGEHPPPELLPGAGMSVAETCPDPPVWPPPGEPQGCTELRWHTFTLEWRESFARVWWDGKLVNEWTAQTYQDHNVQVGGSLPWRLKHVANIQQPLFVALTACVMNDVPLTPHGDASPQYFAVDWVRVCE